jgi:hypothetical protein
MGKSILQTGPSLKVKISYPDSAEYEKTIGYAAQLRYTIVQGQKLLHTVDTPFPAEIAQSAAPSFVRGAMKLYLPKGMMPEQLGLVPYRTDAADQNAIAATKYFNMRILDRNTGALVVTFKFCKVSGYTVNVAIRNIVTVDLTFEAILATTGGLS